jgi:hypothetical protein
VHYGFSILDCRRRLADDKRLCAVSRCLADDSTIEKSRLDRQSACVASTSWKRCRVIPDDLLCIFKSAGISPPPDIPPAREL